MSMPTPLRIKCRDCAEEALVYPTPVGSYTCPCGSVSRGYTDVVPGAPAGGWICTVCETRNRGTITEPHRCGSCGSGEMVRSDSPRGQRIAKGPSKSGSPAPGGFADSCRQSLVTLVVGGAIAFLLVVGFMCVATRSPAPLEVQLALADGYSSPGDPEASYQTRTAVARFRYLLRELVRKTRDTTRQQVADQASLGHRQFLENCGRRITILEFMEGVNDSIEKRTIGMWTHKQAAVRFVLACERK